MAAFSGISTNRLLMSAMTVAERNHKYIANNIANVDTPHYNPVRMDFQKALDAALTGQGELALRTSHPRHLGGTVRQTEFERLAELSKNDYNKVDLDAEIAALSENTGRYSMYATLLTSRFRQEQNVISGLNR